MINGVRFFEKEKLRIRECSEPLGCCVPSLTGSIGRDPVQI